MILQGMFNAMKGSLKRLSGFDWLHLLRDLGTVILLTWLVLFFINFFIGWSTILPLCDMGVNSGKTDYIRNYNANATDVFTTFDDPQLLYILNGAVGGGVRTRWEAVMQATSAYESPRASGPASRPASRPTQEPSGSENTSGDYQEQATRARRTVSADGPGRLRRSLLTALVRDYGVVFDGPYLDADGTWQLRVFKYDTGSDQANSLLASTLRSELPNKVPVKYPAAEVTIRSHATAMGHAEMTYQLRMWAAGQDEPLVESPPQRLFYRTGWTTYLSFQPVQVLREPDEAAEDIVQTLLSMSRVRQQVTSSHSLPIDGILGKLDQSVQDGLQRLFSAVFRVLLSNSSSQLNLTTSHTGGTHQLTEASPDIKETLTTRLRTARILNGVDFSGVINILVFVFVIWGVASVFRAKENEKEREAMLARAHSLISLLPMLGFFGTLYGMLLAFSTVGVGEGGAELVSMIGISLDTTVIAVSGAIILSLAVMWKERYGDNTGSTNNRERPVNTLAQRAPERIVTGDRQPRDEARH